MKIFDGSQNTVVDLRHNFIRTVRANHSGIVLLAGNEINCNSKKTCWCEDPNITIDYAGGNACCRPNGCSQPAFGIKPKIVDSILLSTQFLNHPPGTVLTTPRMPSGQIFTGLGAQCNAHVTIRNDVNMSVGGRMYSIVGSAADIDSACGPAGRLVTDAPGCIDALVTAGLQPRPPYLCSTVNVYYNEPCLRSARHAADCLCGPFFKDCIHSVCFTYLNKPVLCKSNPDMVNNSINVVVAHNIVCEYDCVDSGSDIRYFLDTSVKGLTIDTLTGIVTGIPIGSSAVRVVACLPMTNNITVWERTITFAPIHSVEDVSSGTITGIAVGATATLVLSGILLFRGCRKSIPLSYVKHIQRTYNLPEMPDGDINRLILRPSSVDMKHLDAIGSGLFWCAAFAITRWLTITVCPQVYLRWFTRHDFVVDTVR